MAQADPKTTSRHDAPTVLRLARTFAAPREAVFRAFTEAEAMSEWFGPKGCTCRNVVSDARPGGRYSLEMHTGEGNVYHLSGAFREVTPPERLVYTWVWGEGDFAGVETLVTLAFHDRGGQTELDLTHELLPGERARELHEQGWSSSFDCLAEVLAA